MDITINVKNQDRLSQILAAALVQAIYLRMALYGKHQPEDPVVAASKETLALWQDVLEAIQSSTQDQQP